MITRAFAAATLFAAASPGTAQTLPVSEAADQTAVALAAAEFCGFDTDLQKMISWSLANVAADRQSIFDLLVERRFEDYLDALGRMEEGQLATLCERVKPELVMLGWIAPVPPRPVEDLASVRPFRFDLSRMSEDQAEGVLIALDIAMAECPGLSRHRDLITSGTASVSDMRGPGEWQVGLHGEKGEFDYLYDLEFIVSDEGLPGLPRSWGQHFEVRITPTPGAILVQKEVGAFVCDIEPSPTGANVWRLVDAASRLPLPPMSVRVPTKTKADSDATGWGQFE